MVSVPVLGMHRPILRGERESEYGFPSQGTAPISPLFSRAQFLVCFGAGQQNSSGYSLAKEGTPRHQANGPRSFVGAAGVVRSTSDNRGLNQPPRLRPLRRLRGIFLMGAATPPCPRRGLRLSLQLFSMPPCSAKDVGHGKLEQERNTPSA